AVLAVAQLAVAARGLLDLDAGAAHAGRRRTRVAGLDLLAVGGAAVARLRVAVVAGFVADDGRVTAHDGRGARLAGRRALEERLDRTHARAAVTRRDVAVVALLGAVQDAVAAVFVLHARFARHRARPARLQRAGGRAAVLVQHVAVVAAFALIDHAVAALG